jgi:hypothetical protein
MVCSRLAIDVSKPIAISKATRTVPELGWKEFSKFAQSLAPCNLVRGLPDV